MKIRINSSRKFVLIAMLFFATLTVLRANTITVTNTNDSGPGSLRQALADANDGDAIEFAVTGTIGLTSGELLVDKSITISGPGAGSMTIDGNATSRVFHISSGQTVTISGLTITRGSASGNFPDDSGAGIYNDHATLTLSNCEISGNSAAGSGGAIYMQGQDGTATLQISNCMITSNTADSFDNGGGGGIYSNGENQGTAAMIISNSTISDNSAVGVGGAIFNNGGFSGNADLDVTDSTISGNFTQFNGGGIFNDGEEYGSATVQINNSTLSNNSAQQQGGGIFNDGYFFGTANLRLNNSTLSGNSAKISGGGIYSIGYGGNAALDIANSTLSGNSVAQDGGGIYNSGYAGKATLVVRHTTFTDNSAQFSGGSMYNFGGQGGNTQLELANTILKSGNIGGNIFNDRGAVTSLGYNLASDDGGGFLTGPGDQINTDPLLGPLQNNGGPTFTHELLQGSPAIDAGDLKFIPPPFYDQRGPDFFRVRNDRIDIGSFEVQAGSAPRVVPRPRPTPHPRP